MAETTTYQCPNCSGKLHFDGSIGKLRCEFCDSEFTPQEVEQLYAAKQEKADAKEAKSRRDELTPSGGAGGNLTKEQIDAMNAAYDRAISEGKTPDQAAAEAKNAAAAMAPAGGAQKPSMSAAAASVTEATQVKPHHATTGDPIQDYIANSKWSSSETDDLRAFNCPACGAQLLVDQVTAVTSCPYCGNNAVVPGQLSDVLKPDYVIPFKLDKSDAIAALKQYYKGKRYLPNDFTEENHLEEIQGVYVPFWLYSGKATGDVTFNGRNLRTWSDSKNNYVETDHWLLHRVGTMDFQRVPVDGSTRMPDAHMDAIEPFDYSEMVPFSVGYLPGYITDRYDQDVKDCDPRARSRIEATCTDAMQGTANGYMEIDVAEENSTIEWTDISYALLPVWMLHTKWANEDFLFAMNGQTGKLIGDLPIQTGKVYRRFATIFLPLAVVIGAAIFFLFGFGM